jgi:rubredoxin
MQSPLDIDFEAIPDIKCPKCSNRFWTTVVRLKTIPMGLSPTGEESLLPVPGFKCDQCGYVKIPERKKP